MLVNERAGSAELDRLAETLRPPCRLGDFTLEGLIVRTSTALVFIARDSGGAECVLKATGQTYAPVLSRELDLLQACAAANVAGVVRPLSEALLAIETDAGPAIALQLPFLAGGDLVQWIGAHATRTGRLGAAPALQIGELVGAMLRDLLQLPRPIVHGDVKPQNVLLPRPDAPLVELTLIDFDASARLEAPPSTNPSPPVARQLVSDVNGFGELLFMLATGREPPPDEDPSPATGNTAFDALVERCITAEPGARGYALMAGDGLWRDLEQAKRVERRRSREVLLRPVLGIVGVLLFCVLVLAVLSKLAIH